MDQRLESGGHCETVVVASGCADRTEAIAREFAARGRIRLLVQPAARP
ncbi:MAG: hypothetical protein IPK53_07585 [bacterium]|nr:hypothetical protein [bacterium]